LFSQVPLSQVPLSQVPLLQVPLSQVPLSQVPLLQVLPLLQGLQLPQVPLPVPLSQVRIHSRQTEPPLPQTSLQPQSASSFTPPWYYFWNLDLNEFIKFLSRFQ